MSRIHRFHPYSKALHKADRSAAPDGALYERLLSSIMEQAGVSAQTADSSSFRRKPVRKSPARAGMFSLAGACLAAAVALGVFVYQAPEPVSIVEEPVPLSGSAVLHPAYENGVYLLSQREGASLVVTIEGEGIDHPALNAYWFNGDSLYLAFDDAITANRLSGSAAFDAEGDPLPLDLSQAQQQVISLSIPGDSVTLCL